jgi:hypothetical protein
MTTRTGHDTLKSRKSLTIDGKSYDYFSLPEAAKHIGDVARLPFSMKVLLENLLRFEDGVSVTTDDVKACQAHGSPTRVKHGIPPRTRADAGFHRRSRRGRSGGDARGDEGAGRRPAKINPLVPLIW